MHIFATVYVNVMCNLFIFCILYLPECLVFLLSACPNGQCAMMSATDIVCVGKYSSLQMMPYALCNCSFYVFCTVHSNCSAYTYFGVYKIHTPLPWYVMGWLMVVYILDIRVII